MASDLIVTPAEYRGDVRLRALPDRLRAVESFVAMVAILVLAIVIDLVWKRTHGTAPSLSAGVAAAAKGT
jgi:hypothetical protein